MGHDEFLQWRFRRRKAGADRQNDASHPAADYPGVDDLCRGRKRGARAARRRSDGVGPVAADIRPGRVQAAQGCRSARDDRRGRCKAEGPHVSQRYDRVRCRPGRDGRWTRLSHAGRRHLRGGVFQAAGELCIGAGLRATHAVHTQGPVMGPVPAVSGAGAAAPGRVEPRESGGLRTADERVRGTGRRRRRSVSAS